jgi:hypothetical protein
MVGLVKLGVSDTLTSRMHRGFKFKGVSAGQKVRDHRRHIHGFAESYQGLRHTNILDVDNLL